MEKLFMKKISCCAKCPAFGVGDATNKDNSKGCGLYEINLYGFDSDNLIHPNCQLLDADKVLEIKMKE